jgi:putative glycosyltransferase (TIGR04348 family)
MKIALVTPANLGSQTGNSITAVRWASILSSLGHQVAVMSEYCDEHADLMIALNAYRSRTSILTYRDKNPDKPLVVALTGTDLYRFMDSHPKETLRSIEASDRLIVLSNLAVNVLPLAQQHKVRLIYESAKPLPSGRHPIKRYFDVCLIGHLRIEKDPMLAAVAARNLPASSRIRIRHYGKAHTEEWAEMARNEMLENKRYTWFGEVPHWQVRRALSKCKLMILTSRIEGGPNSLSEAVVAKVPVITTAIDGCIGVLGQGYQGYFPVGDDEQLTELLTRTETDVKFLATLEKFIIKVAPKFSRDEEEAHWANLLTELISKKTGERNE